MALPRLTRAREWLRHAFAIEDAHTVEISESDRMLIERICTRVVERRLATPALVVLEMHRPFNYVSAQVLHVLEPVLSSLADPVAYRAFSRFLEQRGSIDYLAERIRALDDEHVGRLRQDGLKNSGSHD